MKEWKFLNIMAQGAREMVKVKRTNKKPHTRAEINSGSRTWMHQLPAC